MVIDLVIRYGSDSLSLILYDYLILCLFLKILRISAHERWLRVLRLVLFKLSILLITWQLLQILWKVCWRDLKNMKLFRCYTTSYLCGLRSKIIVMRAWDIIHLVFLLVSFFNNGMAIWIEGSITRIFTIVDNRLVFDVIILNTRVNRDTFKALKNLLNSYCWTALPKLQLRSYVRTTAILRKYGSTEPDIFEFKLCWHNLLRDIIIYH